MEAGPRQRSSSRISTSRQLSGRTHILSIMSRTSRACWLGSPALFSRRGFNIDTARSGRTDDPSVLAHHPHPDAPPPDRPGDQAAAQKLGQRLEDPRMEPEETVAREMAMFKVSAAVENRAEIIQFAEIFRAKIVDVSRRTMTIEVTGSPTDRGLRADDPPTRS
jgi:acetolactate synthase-1/3 small subunit